MNKKNPKLDARFNEPGPWQKGLKTLRSIVLDTPLTEELKWGKPCYTFQGKNVAIVYGLKESFAIAFFKGVLLRDTEGILIKPGANTQGGRWMKFTSLAELVEMEPVVRAYIEEAIELEKSGVEVEYKTTPEPVPEELQNKLREMPALKAAFNALTPGRQRGYILYFSAAKQSNTRLSRIEKYTARILEGRGMHDY